MTRWFRRVWTSADQRDDSAASLGLSSSLDYSSLVFLPPPSAAAEEESARSLSGSSSLNDSHIASSDISMMSQAVVGLVQNHRARVVSRRGLMTASDAALTQSQLLETRLFVRWDKDDWCTLQAADRAHSLVASVCSDDPTHANTLCSDP